MTEITDQIARDYLRDRDITCPRCQYPLRDATSRICPECGCAFDLLVCDPKNPDEFQRLIRFGLFFMMLLALMELVMLVNSFIQIVVIGGLSIVTVGFYGIMFIFNLLAWLALFIYVLSKWLKAKRCLHLRRRAITVPATIMLMVYGVPFLIQLFWSIYY